MATSAGLERIAIDSDRPELKRAKAPDAAAQTVKIPGPASPARRNRVWHRFCYAQAIRRDGSSIEVAAQRRAVGIGVAVISSASRVSRGFGAMTTPRKSKAGWRDGVILVALGVVLVAGGRIALPGTAAARDLDGRYANSPLKSWFESLHSSKGPCCSDADGTALSDVDWEAKDGHYRVRIEGQWWDVPDDAVIREPNRAGRTMVWPVYYRANNPPLRVEIRCFMPGTMT